MCKKENFYTYLCSILLIMYEYLHNYELPQIQHNLCKIFTHFFYSVINYNKDVVLLNLGLGIDLK